MKVIYLVRHAQASFGKKNYDQLSPLGFEQSELLANFFSTSGLTFSSVFSGTLMRHQQTAQATLTALNQEIAIDPDWDEFDHQEIFTVARQHNPQWEDNAHLTSAKILLERFTFAVNRWMQPTNAHQYQESWSAFSTRAQRALNSLIEILDTNAIVFTSGGVISALMAELWQLSAHQTQQLNLGLVNTGVTKLLVTSQGVQVSSINTHCHLDTHNHKNKITYK